MTDEKKYVSTCELVQKLVNAQVEINRAVFELNKYGSVIDDALEKQAPMKPTEFYTNGYADYSCPLCGMDVYSEMSYCPNCGQAIDWRKE